ncbi:MAG: sugar phosphate nucleotidyltransferase [Planctomycetota bacterium]|nr:sugar phosphate nucleotidyltransferase [Planctomycetota bacterium]
MLALVLAGGRGHRLKPLTDRRAKPVVPFAEQNLVDFTLENCVRSGVKHVVVLAQYRADTVVEAVERCWASHFETLQFLTPDRIGRAYRGTADSVRAALARDATSRSILVLAADHVYHMDYRPFLAAHRRRRVTATISVTPVPRAEASRFGVVELGVNHLVRRFLEKPARPPAMGASADESLASMGIYAFDRIALERYLSDFDRADDFGRDVLPGLLATGHKIAAYTFGAPGESSVWFDIADVDAYHGALMDLKARNSEGLAVVEKCVVGNNVRIAVAAEVVECVLLDNVIIGADCRLRRVIVEDGVVIPPGTVLGYGEDPPWPGLHASAGGVLVLSAVPSRTPAPRPAAPRRAVPDPLLRRAAPSFPKARRP